MKGAVVIILASLASVVLASWMRRQGVHPDYVRAVVASGWLYGFVASMPFTTLKGWPARAQVLFIGVILLVLTAITIAGTTLAHAGV